MDDNRTIKSPPKGLAILMLIGPSIVWCSEYIGSGEVILATRTGAILGTAVIWAVVVGIFLKFWIGMSGAHYTVCTGEGMIDLFGRMPGPKNWAVWIILVAQFAAGAIGMGGIASASGIFIASLTGLDRTLASLIIAFLAVFITWSGKFDWLKYIMSVFVIIILVGVIYVAVHVFPDMKVFLSGLIPKAVEVPAWALDKGVDPNPWREILPLIGWGAGGFASQVWYSYWIMGAGYGAAKKDVYGEPANVDWLKTLGIRQALNLKKWTRIVYSDAIVAMIIGTAVTLGFLIAGSGTLGVKHLAPEGEQVALELSNLFSIKWGKLGATLFLLGGTAALISTLIGQLAGWPRLVADSFRICIPKVFGRFSWKTQFRFFLMVFLFSNIFIVNVLGYKPVALVKLSALMDGLMLTPLQALLIIIGLYFIMPKMFSKETYQILRPHWIIPAILVVTIIVFSYFCIFQIPYVF